LPSLGSCAPFIAYPGRREPLGPPELHAAHPGRKPRIFDIQFDIHWKLAHVTLGAQTVELVDFVTDRCKTLETHGYTALSMRSLRWEDFRGTGSGQKA
jgi:hypothetical protein